MNKTFFTLFLVVTLVVVQSSALTVYVQVGASDNILFDEIAYPTYSPLLMGKISVSGDPVVNSVGSPIGYAARSCMQVYLDRIHDQPAIGDLEANYPEYIAYHERHPTANDTSLEGLGGWECVLDVVLGQDTLVLKGFLEQRFNLASSLAVVGGTGEYHAVGGEAIITAVDAASCQNVAFHSSSAASDCVLRLDINLNSVDSVGQKPLSVPRLYEHIGASQITHFQEVAASTWKLGDRYVSGNPLYKGAAPSASSYTGYSAKVCYEVYLDSSDSRYQQVQSAVGSRLHNRPAPQQGDGAWLCEFTFAMPQRTSSRDSLSLVGIIESKFDKVSTVAVVGGQGAYINVRGTATVSVVNPSSCRLNAFKSDSLPGSCVLAFDFDLVKNANPVSNKGSVPWVEMGGGSIAQNFDEVIATAWRLGNTLPFVSPIYDDILEAGGKQIGWDGGYCYKVYLDAAWGNPLYPNALGYDMNPYTYSGQDDFDVVAALPGFHTRTSPPSNQGGVNVAGAGAWFCAWTTHLEAGAVTVQGFFGDSPYITNYFAVVGGTGAYAGITGEMVDDVNNVGTYNQDYCVYNGFILNALPFACEYVKTNTVFYP